MNEVTEMVHFFEFEVGREQGVRLCDSEVFHIDNIPYAPLNNPMDMCKVCEDMVPLHKKPNPRVSLGKQIAYTGGWVAMLAGMAFLVGTVISRGSFAMGIASLILALGGTATIIVAGMSR